MDGIARPWSMAFLNDDEALIAEKDGTLLKVNLETKERISISGVPSDVADSLVVVARDYPLGTYPTGTNGFKGRYNGGLMDVKLDPDFADNRWIYLSYSAERDKKYALKVIRARLRDNALSDLQVILEAGPYIPGLFHFGGGLTFGMDGMLYITVGERLFSEILEPDMPIAQDLNDRRGKIYRLHPDGSIPKDNPGFGSSDVPGLYAIGIRAAQGITVDPRNGDIWFSEHGTRQGDEVNLLEKGANYGWPLQTSGGYRYLDYSPPELDRSLTIPKWFWHETVAPTGLVFYTGDEFPQWKNNLIVPGLSRGNFWRLVIEDRTVKSIEQLFMDDRSRIRKAVQGPDGQLYVLTDEPNGKVIRITNGSMD